MDDVLVNAGLGWQRRLGDDVSRDAPFRSLSSGAQALRHQDYKRSPVCPDDRKKLAEVRAISRTRLDADVAPGEVIDQVRGRTSQPANGNLSARCSTHDPPLRGRCTHRL